jgi:predicted transposase/invertase (TIGR01784 family)
MNPSISQEDVKLTLADDLVFKAVFTANPHLLADLINAVRGGQPAVVALEILNPGLPARTRGGKQIVMDILARDESGAVFNIEIQIRFYRYWPSRSVFYLARAVDDQLKKSEDYERIKPAIGINLLVDDLFTDRPNQARWCFTMRDAQQPSVELGDTLELHIVELTKAERLRGLPPALKDWTTALLHSPDEDVMNQISHPPTLEALQNMEQLLSADEQVRWDALRQKIAILDERYAFNQARREGLAEGEARGRAEGETHGKATLLLQQLTRKFGPLPDSTRQRITNASPADLDAWALNLLDAPTLEAVFGS